MAAVGTFGSYPPSGVGGGGGGGSAPAVVAVGPDVTTAVSVSSGAFANFSGATVSFTPTVDGDYLIRGLCPTSSDTANVNGYWQIACTVGSATIKKQQSCPWRTIGANFQDTRVVEASFTLSKGVSYTFNVQAIFAGGTLYIRGDVATFNLVAYQA